MKNSSGIHKGHRQRMRRRFVENSARFFDTYELLEMLLYHVIPYKDTNPTAKMLISHFGNIDAVMRASKEELMLVPGVGEGVAEYILTVGRLTDYGLMTAPDEYVCYDDYHVLGSMISEYFATRIESESAVVAFALDNAMRLIGAKMLYEYDFESGAVRADAFIEYAISTRATVVVTAHVHRRGPLFPTVGDMATLRLVADALDDAGVIHAEHYLIVGEKYLGIMNRISDAFRQIPAIDRFVESKEGERI